MDFSRYNVRKYLCWLLGISVHLYSLYWLHNTSIRKKFPGTDGFPVLCYQFVLSSLNSQHSLKRECRYQPERYRGLWAPLPNMLH